MTRKQALETEALYQRLQQTGISRQDAETLRRISMTLHKWHERECGDEYGCIERDETTGKTWWRSSTSGRRFQTADRETGARTRLAKIMHNYPDLRAYIQGDPRGAALYILRENDAPKGQEDSHYSRGIAVYQ